MYVHMYVVVLHTVCIVRVHSCNTVLSKGQLQRMNTLTYVRTHFFRHSDTSQSCFVLNFLSYFANEMKVGTL